VTAYSKFASLLVLGISMCPALFATTAYTSFSGTNFDDGISINTQEEIAGAFSPSVSGNLLSLTFALGTSPNADAANNIEDVFLYSDASGKPGTVLESLTMNAGTFHDPKVDRPDLIVTVNSVTHPMLTAGVKYWVGLETGNPGINPVIWYFGFGSDPGLQAFSQGAWVAENPQPTTPVSLGVDVSSAPEPGTCALMGAGLIALGYSRGRRR
jgi:hypothetical protein